MHHTNVLVMQLCSSQPNAHLRPLGLLKPCWDLLPCDDLATWVHLLYGYTLLEEEGMKLGGPLVSYGISMDLCSSQSHPALGPLSVLVFPCWQPLYSEAGVDTPS